MNGTEIEGDALPGLDKLSAMLDARLSKPGAPAQGTGHDAIEERSKRERRIAHKRDARRTTEEPKDQFQQVRCSKAWKSLAKRVARRRGFANVSEMIIQLVIEADQGG